MAGIICTISIQTVCITIGTFSFNKFEREVKFGQFWTVLKTPTNDSLDSCKRPNAEKQEKSDLFMKTANRQVEKSQ